MVDAYDYAVKKFSWNIPESFNLGEAVSDAQVRAGRKTAIIATDEEGAESRYTFDYLKLYSNKLANLFASRGWLPGNRIAVVLPASVEAAIAHIAILKAGMVSVPMIADPSTDYTDRLLSAGVVAICTTDRIAAAWSAEWLQLPGPPRIIVLRDESPKGSTSRMERTIGTHRARYRAMRCAATHPALLSFTSGSEGKPKGVLHAHGLLLGALPALLFAGIPKPDDIVWSHFDWGWLGGLLVPLGAWFHGSAVVVDGDQSFAPARTIELLRRFAVTRVSIAPTALKILQIGARAMEFPRLSSITTGGEKLDPATVDWVRGRFGIELSEIYGLTECSAVMGSGQLVPRRQGALGKPAPGQQVHIVDDEGTPLEPGEVGQIAVQAPHPAMFLGYWQDEEATRARFRDDLLLTGDLAKKDEDGYYHYVSRADDVIKRAGRRIGPGEIESAFGTSAAVDLCTAVGIPDALVGERIVLWVTLNPSWAPTAETEAEIMAKAATSLPSYQLPDRIRFVRAMPLTSNGKVHRRAVREAEIASGL